MRNRRTLPIPEPLLQRFQVLVAERFGLEHPPNRRSDLLHRIEEAMGLAGFQDPALFFQAAAAAPAGPSPVLDALAAALTVGETGFFRHRAQFGALTGQVLPALIRERRGERQALRLWSCGCATGEEPYSLAIALRQLLPDLDRWQITLVGTDLNRQALQRAQEGRYSAWSFRETDPALRGRYFTQSGSQWVLDPAVRRQVEFRPLNLMDPYYPGFDPPAEPYDLILCRNVTIYFSPERTQQVLDKLFGALRPGGWLLVGPAEPNMTTYRRFETHTIEGATFYRRPLEAGSTGDSPWASSRDLTPGLRPVAQPGPALPPATGIADPVAPSTPPPAPVEPAPRDPVDLYARARALALTGRHAAAREALQSLLAGQPGHTEASLLLARLCADDGDLAQAEHLARQVLRRERVVPDAHFTLAMVYQEQGRWQEAADAFRTALFLDRDHLPSHYLLGMLHRRQGRGEQAARAFQNAADLAGRLPPDAALELLGGVTAGELLRHLQQSTLRSGPNGGGGQP